MNNEEYVRNLMVIHRELYHHISEDTMNKFDETIAVAILALSECGDFSEGKVSKHEVP